VTANLKIILLFENQKLLSACKPKLSILSITLNVKQFLGPKEKSLKMERGGLDFSTVIAIIICVIDDAEHDYGTTTIIKLNH
jgi:hypothetical protein